MKAYLFDTDTGIYEGDTFMEADMLALEDGITTFAPPDYEKGQVPVFDRRMNAWTIIPVTIAKKLLSTKERT